MIEVPRDYKLLNGVIKAGDKIYLSCARRGKQASDQVPPNSELLVFSAKSRSIIKKIKIASDPYKLAFDPSVAKIYIQYNNIPGTREFIDIVDITADKVIGRIRLANARMLSAVIPGKMYASFGSYNTDKGLVVIDTRSDRIIKRFDGDYRGISERSYVN